VSYKIDDLEILIKCKKINFGISRVVWNGSLVMAKYLSMALSGKDKSLAEKLKLKSHKRILELGAGTGLGGIFA
jgi:hypothetical protein